MKTVVSNEIVITDPNEEIISYCKSNLVIANPEYEKKFRMHFWVGNTPEKLWLYKVDGDDYILPYGVLSDILPMLDGDITTDFPMIRKVDYHCEVP